ncbi:MAG: hypothetical protein QXR60_03825 [Candidatus Nanoarchaeia archaeon]
MGLVGGAGAVYFYAVTNGYFSYVWLFVLPIVTYIMAGAIFSVIRNLRRRKFSELNGESL